MFTWKTFVWSTVAGLSLLAGLPSDADACCGWGGGRSSYYAGYYPAYYGGYYGAGYYGYNTGYYGASYYGGYAPSYGGCSSCGSCYGGCSSCGPSCGYACAGSGCAGGGCGVTAPAGNSTRPTPDDGFREGPGGNPADNAPADAPPGTRRRRTPPPTFENREESPANSSGGSARPNIGNPRNEGLDPTRGGTRPAPESTPATDEETYDVPVRPKRGVGGDRFDNSSKKEPMPKSNADADPDAFIEEDETVPAKTKANRTDLGEPSTVIPQKKPAPGIEIPADDPPPNPNQPEASKADEAATTTAVAPKTRLVLSGRFATPKVVRLKLRPNQDWIATPAEPVLAKHNTSR